MSSPCPDRTKLKDLLEGVLPQAEQSAVNDHLEACESCQQRLESLVAGKESWAGAAQQLAGAGAAPDPALSDVIARGKNAADPAETSGESAATEPPSMTFLQPTDQPGYIGRLGRYEVIEAVGRGGFGIVLRAFDPSL